MSERLNQEDFDAARTLLERLKFEQKAFGSAERVLDVFESGAKMLDGIHKEVDALNAEKRRLEAAISEAKTVKMNAEAEASRARKAAKEQVEQAKQECARAVGELNSRRQAVADLLKAEEKEAEEKIIEWRKQADKEQSAFEAVKAQHAAFKRQVLGE